MHFFRNTGFLLVLGVAATLNLFPHSSVAQTLGDHSHHHHHLQSPMKAGEKKESPPRVKRRETQPREADYYKLLTYNLPQDAILEGGGICTLPNSKLAVSTRRGEIWVISSPYGTDSESKPSFRRFARGLHEILGLAYRNGSFYVAQRGELTRITDSDGDGEADRYECVAPLPTVGHYHEYSFGPVFDREGNAVVSLNVAFGDPDWYNAKSFAPWRGWIIKIRPDGSIEPWAAGVRSPCGIGIGPEGKVFYTENQGDWVGSGYFTVVEKGDFVASPAGLNWADSPGSPVTTRKEQIRNFGLPLFEVKKEVPGIRLPSVWLPHGVLGVSTSDFVLDSTGGKFGPFQGQYFIGDQGQSKITRVYLEKVNGVYQGCAFGFREGFASGVLRLCWGTDGSLFAAQTNRGWASTGTAPFALQRVVWNGKAAFEMKEISALPDGFEIRFTQPVDPVTASDPRSYQVGKFTYLYHQTYGSPVVREGNCPIRALRVSDDRLSVRLVVDSLSRHFIHEIKADSVLSETGLELLHPVGYYTLHEFPEARPADMAAPGWVKATPKPVEKPRITTPAVPSPSKPASGKPVVAATPVNKSFTVAPELKRVNKLPPTWSLGPEKSITLGTVPGMKYDQTVLEVKAGQKVKLTFNNYDDMQHNVVIVRPGMADKIGETAAKLGTAGNRQNYVPNSDLVLFHSGIVQPTSNETLYFQAPTIPGDYPFVCTMPGHYMLMRGVLRVKR